MKCVYLLLLIAVATTLVSAKKHKHAKRHQAAGHHAGHAAGQHVRSHTHHQAARKASKVERPTAPSIPVKKRHYTVHGAAAAPTPVLAPPSSPVEGTVPATDAQHAEAVKAAPAAVSNPAPKVAAPVTAPKVASPVTAPKAADAVVAPKASAEKINQMVDPDEMDRRQDIPLPDIMTLVSTKTEKGTTYKLGPCSLDVSSDECTFTFIPKSDECKDKFSLGKLAKHFFPDKNLTAISGKFINPGIFDVERFEIDKCAGDVSMDAVAKEGFDVIKGKLRVMKGKVKVSLNYKKEVSFQSFGIDVNGEVKIGGKSVPLTVVKKKDTPEFKFSIKTESISASDFAQMFSKKKLEEQKDTDAPSKTALFTNAIIQEPLITGTRGKDESFEFVVKGQLGGIAGLGAFTIFVLVQKQVDDPTGVTVVADLKKIQPTQILSALLGKDLSGIPLISKFEMNVALEFSNQDVLVVKDPDINILLGKFLVGAKTICKGTKIKVDIPIKEILQKVNSGASLDHVPKSMLIQIMITDTMVDFKFPENVEMQLLNILMVLIPKVPEVIFEKVFKTSPKIVMKKFNVNVQTKFVHVQAVAPEEIRIGNDIIAVKEAEFELTHKPDGPWNFKMKAKKQIAGVEFDITIEKKGDEFVFHGELASLSTKQLAMHFGAKEMAEKTIEKLSFLNFGIDNLKVDAGFGGEKLALRISGNPVMFDWNGMKLEGFILDHNNTKQMALGVVMEGIRLDKIIEKILKKKIAQATWMNSASASITMSNMNFNPKEKDLQFTLPELKKLGAIKKGVYFKSEVTVPNDCEGDKLCELAKSKLRPGAKLYLEGEIRQDGIQLKAGYRGEITFGKKAEAEAQAAQDGQVAPADNRQLVMRDVHFVLDADLGSLGIQVYIEGEMKLADVEGKRDVTFKAKIGVSAIGSVELKLMMHGMWDRPFGISYFSFGNIEAGIEVSPGVPIPAVEFTGQLTVGKIGNGKEITAKAAVGYDPIQPLNIYVYAEINKFTLGAIAEAFEFPVPMPKVVLESGFPEGVKVGFTFNPKGKKIAHMKVEIESGFSFAGVINILGQNLKSKIVIPIAAAVPQEFLVDVQMDPLKIAGGALTLTKGEKREKEGPSLYIRMARDEVVVRIDAYACLLGIGAGASVDISNKGFKFSVVGNLFNILRANVSVTADYGSLDKVGFKVAACLSTDVDAMKEAATNEVTGAADETKEADKLSDNTTKDASSWYEKAVKSLNKWEEKLNQMEEAMRRKAGKIEKYEKYMETSCKEHCKSEKAAGKRFCLGGPAWDSKCSKRGGVWFGCPVWNPCKHAAATNASTGHPRNFFTDSYCLASCKAQKVKYEIKVGIKKAWMEVLLKAVEAAKVVLSYTKEVVVKSKELIDTAQKASQNLATAIEAGKEAVEAVAKYTKDNLFNIHYVCFDTSLAKASSKCFSFKANITIGGTKNLLLKTEACLDSSFLKDIGISIANQLYPGIDGIKSGVAKAKSWFKKADDKKEAVIEQEKEAAEKEKELETLEKQQPKDDDDTEDDDEDERNAMERAQLIGEENSPFSTDSDDEEPIVRHTFHNKTAEVAYWHKLTYRPAPSVAIRDEDSMEEFERTSPWAFSKHDNPFTDYHNNNTVPEDVPILKAEIDVSNLDKRSACAQTKTIIQNYGLVSETVNFLLDAINKEQYAFLQQAEKYEKNIKVMERSVIQRAERYNYTDDTLEDSMFYINRLKNGTALWMQTVRKQLDEQDKQMLSNWRKSFENLVQSASGVGLEKYINKLKKAADTSKRADVPNLSPVHKGLNTVSKTINSLLNGPLVELTSKKEQIDNLTADINNLRQAVEIPCAHNDVN